MKRKNVFFIFFVFLFMLAISLLNYLVDPYSFVRNQKNVEVWSIPRNTFYIALKVQKALKRDFILIGSSELIGMASGVPHFNKKSNVVALEGMNYSNYYEILENYLKIYPNTKKVFIFLNYSCLFDEMLHAQSLPPFFSKDLTVSELAHILFSFDMTFMSLNHCIQYLKHNFDQSPNADYVKVFCKEITFFDPDVNNKKFSLINEKNFLFIKKIIDLLENKNIEYTFVIPPYSATYLSIISDYPSLHNQVNNFKRTLVRLVPNHIKIYDFAFPNKYTSVNLLEDTDAYYNNFNHPNSYWGSKIYRILFDLDNISNDDKSLYYFLNQNTIESVIESQNKLLYSFKCQNEISLEFYRRLVSAQNTGDSSYRKVYKKNFSFDLMNEVKYLNSL